MRVKSINDAKIFFNSCRKMPLNLAQNMTFLSFCDKKTCSFWYQLLLYSRRSTSPGHNSKKSSTPSGDRGVYTFHFDVEEVSKIKRYFELFTGGLKKAGTTFLLFSTN